MESYHNTAIVFGSLKDALLHFEYVIPMNVVGQFMGLRPINGSAGGSVEKFKEPGMEGYRELNDVFIRTEDLQKLYPLRLQKQPLFKSAMNVFDGLLFAYMIRTIHGEESFRSYVEKLAKAVNVSGAVKPDYFCPTVEGLRRLFCALVRDFQLFEIPVDCSRFYFGFDKDAPSVNTLQIPQIRVIDTEKVRFTQIMELREDKRIMRQMRNFRLFAYEQYKGRDKAFIEDDIQKRLDDYSEAVKSSGFETTVKTLSFLFESKFLMGAFATSAASLLFGNPQLAIGAFGAGAVVELGKLSLAWISTEHN